MTRSIRTLQPAILSSLAAFCATGTTHAQLLGPDFVGDYTIVNLGTHPGVPTPYGGMEFKAGDPNKLLMVGMSEDPLAAIYEVDVTRDALGHITGLGSAVQFASTPNADAGLRYGPGGVLFYTAYPINTLGQIKPGSSSADKLVDLNPLGVSSSTGGLSITPAGLPGAGSLKLTSYNADIWYDADLVADGSGTFDVVNVAQRATLTGVGPESILYVDPSYAAFSNASVLVCEWSAESVGAYEIDGNGDPIPSTRRDFLACCGYWPLGSALDPVTGDFLIVDWGSVDQVVVVKPIALQLGMNYCSPANPNSSGPSATITALGLPAASANNLTLVAAQLPPFHFGYFVTGQLQAFLPGAGGSQGTLCIGLPFARLLSSLQNSGAPGTMTHAVDLTNIPISPAVAVQAGETWNFQAWFRDTNPGPTSNFTDGVAITFQ